MDEPVGHRPRLMPGRTPTPGPPPAGPAGASSCNTGVSYSNAASLAETYANWDLVRCYPSCQPTWWPWRLDSHGWRFRRCTGCRTLWVWDCHWREALSPAGLARLEAAVLGGVYERMGP